MPVSFENQEQNKIPERILIVSPDKLALSTFLAHVKKVVGQGYSIAVLHSLMTAEEFQSCLTRLDTVGRWILSYYARRKQGVSDPMTLLPAGFGERADVVLWFDLYATVPVVAKTPPEGASMVSFIIESWKKRIGEGG